MSTAKQRTPGRTKRLHAAAQELYDLAHAIVWVSEREDLKMARWALTKDSPLVSAAKVLLKQIDGE